jgi:methylated-DNA-[protein]-cysteine S-methyltransferase
MDLIPYGETWTYGELAQTAETVPRAVGGACGANPIPVILPCHRVVAANGGAGGYSGKGGLRTKSALLDIENRTSRLL